YAGQPLHNVERRTLSGKQCSRGTLDSCKLGTGRNLFAIVDTRLEHNRVIESREDRLGYFKPAEDELLVRDESSSGFRAASYHGLSGNVASPKVFLEQVGGKGVDDSRVEFHSVE